MLIVNFTEKPKMWKKCDQWNIMKEDKVGLALFTYYHQLCILFLNTDLKTGFHFRNEVVKFQLTVCKHIRKQ